MLSRWNNIDFFAPNPRKLTDIKLHDDERSVTSISDLVKNIYVGSLTKQTKPWSETEAIHAHALAPERAN